MIGKVICLLVVVIAILLGVNEYRDLFDLFGFKCHPGVASPHNFLATKAPYIQPDSSLLSHYPSHGKCEPVQIWMVVRHGTRNPSAKVIKKMRLLLPGIRDQIVEAHKTGKGGLCSSELELLSKWEVPSNLAESEEKKLVTQGQKELQGIGERFRSRFPTLFRNTYYNDTYKFKYTKTERAAESAKHFTKAIFGAKESSKVWYPEPLAADPILRFYKGCPRWKKEVDKNPETYAERVSFETSEVFQTVQKKIQSRCGFEHAISVETVEAIYMTCAFETAWDPSKVSPWCHLFDEEDLEVMQYRQDLEYYWVDGYGYELTYKQACPAVKDLVEHFTSKAEDVKDGPSVIAYFTHSGTLLKLIARFGLFKDENPLLHSNFNLHKDRQWRTSEIDKFATNIAAVLYKCEDEFRVGMYFQEKPVPIAGCEDDLCPLKDFLMYFDSVVKDCDIPQMCNL